MYSVLVVYILRYFVAMWVFPCKIHTFFGKFINLRSFLIVQDTAQMYLDSWQDTRPVVLRGGAEVGGGSLLVPVNLT